MTNKKLVFMAIPVLTVLMIIGISAPAVAGDTGTVMIDIKPGSDPNSINPSSKGVIPVAILGTDIWDASTVDPSTLTFMALGDFAGVSTQTTSGPIGFGFEDVNDDGYIDLVAHFLTQYTWIDCTTQVGALSGTAFDGTLIYGFDSINPVGKDTNGKCQ
jgi:hypothetical protein